MTPEKPLGYFKCLGCREIFEGSEVVVERDGRRVNYYCPNQTCNGSLTMITEDEALEKKK